MQCACSGTYFLPGYRKPPPINQRWEGEGGVRGERKLPPGAAVRDPEIFHRASDLDKASRRGIDKKEKVLLMPEQNCLQVYQLRLATTVSNTKPDLNPTPPPFPPSGIAAVPASRSLFAASGSERCYKCSRPLPLPPMIQKKKTHSLQHVLGRYANEL